MSLSGPGNQCLIGWISEANQFLINWISLPFEILVFLQQIWFLGSMILNSILLNYWLHVRLRILRKKGPHRKNFIPNFESAPVISSTVVKDNNAFQPSCLKCLGLGHISSNRAQQYRSCLCFNYGHISKQCFHKIPLKNWISKDTRQAKDKELVSRVVPCLDSRAPDSSLQQNRI